MNELALFAGAGGGILGAILCGGRTVCAVEINDHARNALLARQNDGCLPPFPVWSDIRSFTARNRNCREAFRRLRRIRDSLRISGGFPCQDISVAGGGDGLDGARSGLWFEMRRVIGEIRPSDVLIENSPALTTRGGIRVIAELTALGYDCRWGIISAADAIWLGGTPCLDHLRERIWIAATRADADSRRREEQWLAELGRIEGARGGFAYGLRADGRQHDAATGADAALSRLEERSRERSHAREKFATVKRAGWWAAEPDVGRVADGVAHRVDRLECTGNGQVPAVVRLARHILKL